MPVLKVQISKLRVPLRYEFHLQRNKKILFTFVHNALQLEVTLVLPQILFINQTADV